MLNEFGEQIKMVTCKVKFNGQEQVRRACGVGEDGRLIPETKPGEILYWTWDSFLPQIVQGQRDSEAAE